MEYIKKPSKITAFKIGDLLQRVISKDESVEAFKWIFSDFKMQFGNNTDVIRVSMKSRKGPKRNESIEADICDYVIFSDDVIDVLSPGAFEKEYQVSKEQDKDPLSVAMENAGLINYVLQKIYIPGTSAAEIRPTWLCGPGLVTF